MRAVRIAAALAAAIVGAAVTHSTVQAYSTYARWASNSVTFYVNPVNSDVSQAAAVAALQAGMDVWNTQAGTSFRYQYGGLATDTATAYDNRNVVMFRNATNGGAIATTYSWWNSSNELVDADIVFWDGGFAFFTGSSGCGVVPNAAYMEDIAAHELGHALGLNHSSVGTATMYPSYSYCSMDNRVLDADDIAGAKQLYASVTNPPPPPANTAPTVTISTPSNNTTVAGGTTVSFSGAANDTEDGALTSSLTWSSNIDGTIGTGGSFSRALSTGTHTVTAQVRDAGGLTSTRQVTVTVTAPGAVGVNLKANGYKRSGYQRVDLTWSGLAGASIDVYRNSAKIMTTPNDSAQTDPINKKGSATYSYKVCDAGTANCSASVNVVF